MSLLTAAEITSMRSTQNEALPDTVVIQRYTTASDGMGGLVETWANVGTVDGRVAAISAQAAEAIIGERLTAAEPYVLTVPQGTTVYERDRLAIGTRTFEIEYVYTHGEWETALRCYGVEVGG